MSIREFAKKLLALAKVAPDDETGRDIRSVVHYLYQRHNVPFRERNLIIKSKIVNGFNSITMLKEETGFTKQQVLRSVVHLQEHGEIEATKVRYHTRGRPAKVFQVVEKSW